MNIWDKLAKRVFQSLKAEGYQLSVYNRLGNTTIKPENGRFFYTNPDHVMVSIIEDNENTSLNVHLSGGKEPDELVNLLNRLRMSSTHFNATFNVKKYDRNLAPKDFAYMTEPNRISEQKLLENVDVPESVSDLFNNGEEVYYFSTDYGMDNNESMNEFLSMIDADSDENIVLHDGTQVLLSSPEYKFIIQLDSSGGGDFSDHVINATPINLEKFKSEYEKNPRLYNMPDYLSSMMGIESISESLKKAYGSKLVSRRPIGSSKIKIIHDKPVNEEIRGSRSRNIKAIFIENNGEVLRYPYNHLRGAYAMARHISNGGRRSDSIGEHIISLSEEFKNLSFIANHIFKNKSNLSEQFMENRDTLRYRISEIKESLNNLIKPTTYNNYVENFSEEASYDLGDVLGEDVYMFGWDLGFDSISVSENIDSFKTALKYINYSGENKMRDQSKGLFREWEESVSKIFEPYTDSSIIKESKQSRIKHNGGKGYYIVTKPLSEEESKYFKPTKLAGPFVTMVEAKSTELWEKIGNKKGPYNTFVSIGVYENEDKLSKRKFKKNSKELKECVYNVIQSRKKLSFLKESVSTLSYEDFNAILEEIAENFKTEVSEELRNNLAKIFMNEFSSGDQNDIERSGKRDHRTEPTDEEDPTKESLDYDEILDEEDPCWDGYKQVGMKKGDDGEEVPNCVPESQNMYESQQHRDYMRIFNKNVDRLRPRMLHDVKKK